MTGISYTLTSFIAAGLAFMFLSYRVIIWTKDKEEEEKEFEDELSNRYFQLVIGTLITGFM